MFHGACTLSDQSLLKMVPSPSLKKRRKNYSSGDVGEAITKIQTGEILQVKAVLVYGIQHLTLARKCKNKLENVAENRPCSLPVLGEAAEKDLVQWAFVM